MEKQKYHLVTWQIPINDHQKIVEFAEKQKRSVQNMAIVLLNKAIAAEKLKKEGESLQMQIAEGNAIQVINDCLTLRQLNSAYTHIKMFKMAYGSSEKVNDAYEAKKELL